MAIAWRYTPPRVNALPRVAASGAVAVRVAAEHLLAASRPLVPVESGALQDSGRVSQDGLQAAVSYGHTDDADTAAYAVVQHERLDYNHPNGGQAKYLEAPMHSEHATVAELLAREVRRALR